MFQTHCQPTHNRKHTGQSRQNMTFHDTSQGGAASRAECRQLQKGQTWYQESQRKRASHLANWEL